MADGSFRGNGVGEENKEEEEEEVRGKMGLNLERKIGEEWEMGVRRRGRDETEGIESNLVVL